MSEAKSGGRGPHIAAFVRAVAAPSGAQGLAAPWHGHSRKGMTRAPSPSGYVLPDAGSCAGSYFSAVLTDVKLDFTAEPRLLTPANIATPIMEAMAAYSIEVAPEQSLTKQRILRMSNELRRDFEEL
jgi:hypothetical protein